MQSVPVYDLFFVCFGYYLNSDVLAFRCSDERSRRAAIIANGLEMPLWRKFHRDRLECATSTSGFRSSKPQQRNGGQRLQELTASHSILR